MLNGRDIQLDAPSRQIAWHAILRSVRSVWKNFVWETLAGQSLNSSDETPELPPGDDELFFYPDVVAVRDWEEVGGTPENQDRLLHVVFRSGERNGAAPVAFTIACSASPGDTERIAHQIEEDLKSLKCAGEALPTTVPILSETKL